MPPATALPGRSPATLGPIAALLRSGQLVALLWVIFLIQILVPVVNLWGIHPRSSQYPQGLVIGHVLHGSTAHLLANSWALLFLLWILLAWSPRRTLQATMIIAALCSVATWIFGSAGSMHLGASGLIFGYVALIISNGFLYGTLSALLIALLVAVLYGGAMAVGVTHVQAGVSWIMHASGLLGGVIAARMLYRRSSAG